MVRVYAASYRANGKLRRFTRLVNTAYFPSFRGSSVTLFGWYTKQRLESFSSVPSDCHHSADREVPYFSANHEIEFSLNEQNFPHGSCGWILLQGLWHHFWCPYKPTDRARANRTPAPPWIDADNERNCGSSVLVCYSETRVPTGGPSFPPFVRQFSDVGPNGKPCGFDGYI